MEFKFKRKYTFFFLFAIVLHALAVGFWFFVPKEVFNGMDGKKTVCLLILINIELILIFYLGLFRKKYYAFHDKLVIKRSFFGNVVISYKDITSIKEKNSDSILLGFGNRPSFTIYYKPQQKAKSKCTVRTDNNKLLLKVLKNEVNITQKK